MTGAVVVARQNKLMRSFESAGAVDAASARSLEDLGIRDSWMFQRMADRGVFLKTASGMYYMSLQNSAEFVQQRKKRVFLITAVLLVVFVIVMYLSKR